jgi:hypothetical protein
LTLDEPLAIIKSVAVDNWLTAFKQFLATISNVTVRRAAFPNRTIQT